MCEQTERRFVGLSGASSHSPAIHRSLSFIPHIKGVRGGRGGHYLSSQPQKDSQENRDVFPTS